MTRYSDNVLSGLQARTSALSSVAPVALVKDFDFNATTGSTTLTGVFPSGSRNLSAELFITQQGSANTSNKITVSAGGRDLVTITSFGSSTGLTTQTATGLATFTYIASACAVIPIPAVNDGGEIPFAVTFLKDAGDGTGTCRLALNFSRKDTTFD